MKYKTIILITTALSIAGLIYLSVQLSVSDRNKMLPMPEDTCPITEGGYPYYIEHQKELLAEYYDYAKIVELRIADNLDGNPLVHGVEVGRYESGEFFINIDSFYNSYWIERTLYHSSLDSLLPMAIERWGSPSNTTEQ
jgi:hypothetical protein